MIRLNEGLLLVTDCWALAGVFSAMLESYSSSSSEKAKRELEPSSVSFEGRGINRAFDTLTVLAPDKDDL